MVVSEEALHFWEGKNPDIRQALEDLLSKNITVRSKKLTKGYKYGEGYEQIPVPSLLSIMCECMYRARHTRQWKQKDVIDRLSAAFRVYDQDVKSASTLQHIYNRLEKALGVGGETKQEFISLRHKRAMEFKAAGKAIPHSKDMAAEYEKLQYEKKLKELKAAEKALKYQKEQTWRKARKVLKTAKEVQGDVKEIHDEVYDKNYTPEHPCVDAYLQAVASDTPPDKEVLMTLYSFAMEEAEKAHQKIAFLPTPNQYNFISASEDIVLYGGAAGGGKSYALLFDGVRYAHMNGYRGVIIRRSMPELRELIDISREIYPTMFKGAKYNSQEKIWRFSSGGVLEFGYLNTPEDKYQYQGKQYAWIGFDELGLQDTPEGFDYLKSRLRTTLPITPAIRATANPGSLWVKERFIDPAPENTTFRDRAGLTYRFIPSRVSDNPYIYQNGEGQYVKMLSSLSEVDRRQLLDGDWTVSDDTAFPEFKEPIHVRSADTHYPPEHWFRFCGVDYGYNDQTAAVWGAVNPENGQIVIYREFAQSRLHGDEAGRAIVAAGSEDLVRVDYVADWSIWNKTGHFGPTIGESMQRAGLRMRRADKNREGGKVQIHAKMSINHETEEPNMIILDNCPRLVKELKALKKADRKAGGSVEDIKQTRYQGNHNDLYDALRYALMSRPRQQTAQDLLLQSKSDAWGRINKMFS